MSKNKGENKKTSISVQVKINDLKTEELKLFHSYNRHAQPQVKLEILNRLIVVINQIDVLNSVNK